MQQQSSGNIFGNMPPIVKNLIFINALMLLATYLFREFMVSHFALFYPGSPLFRPIQLFTHMFMHADVFHLFFNMYALFIFGAVLEKVWGPKRFLTYYLITGFGAAALHLFVMWLEVKHLESLIGTDMIGGMRHLLDEGKVYTEQVGDVESWYKIMYTPTVGASGAVFGILLAFGMLFPNTVLQLLFPPIALKAKWFVMIYGAIELTLGFTNSGSNIAHFAHVGGMLFGYLLIVYWRKQRNNFY